ncbi:MAG: TadE/TadG family type IV pilus assembly protein [Actinomycetota bacterium]|jgi:hypothetical protein
MDRCRHRYCRGCSRSESGISTIETVFVLPVLFFAITVLAQAAVVLHARRVVHAAAQDGAAAARVVDGSAEAGRIAALDTLRQLAPKALEEPIVSATRDDDVARVEVRAHAPGPLFDVALRAASTGVVERFRPERSRP